jgi:hypothetical protein
LVWPDQDSKTMICHILDEDVNQKYHDAVTIA